MARYAIVTEHMIGHVMFTRQLHEAAVDDADIEADFFPLSYAPRGAVEALPGLRSNWSLRSSVRARRLLAQHRRSWDALLFHTQTTALCSVGIMRRVPSVVSIDATPRNFDLVAAGYGHDVGRPGAESIKARIVGRSLHAAAAVVAWSDWVRRSLVDDYGVDPATIRVIPPGTRIPPSVPRRTAGERLRLLFVGGDFQRKGGRELLAALEDADFPWQLDVVTQTGIEPRRPEVVVHHGLRSGSAELARLYAESDLFVFPTHADASPFTVVEAMAAGLPVITTRVGAIPEMISDGQTGMLVEPGDARGLRSALGRATDPEVRARLGLAARARVEQHYDAARNARRVLELLREVGDRS